MTGLQSPRKNNIIFDNRDDGVAEGVPHAVVEELHALLGPEEFRGNGHRRDGMYASCTLSKSRFGRYGSLIRELWILLR